MGVLEVHLQHPNPNPGANPNPDCNPNPTQVHLQRADGLRAADSNGKSDPYAKVRVGRHKGQTRVVPRSLDPRWDERLLFPGTLADFLEETLTIKVRDKDTVGYDDPLGEVQVRLRYLVTTPALPSYHPSARRGAGAPRRPRCYAVTALRYLVTTPPAPPGAPVRPRRPQARQLTPRLRRAGTAPHSKPTPTP